jgi:hypothetical protein
MAHVPKERAHSFVVRSFLFRHVSESACNVYILLFFLDCGMTSAWKKGKNWLFYELVSLTFIRIWVGRGVTDKVCVTT